LADLVAKKQVTPKELAQTAAAAREKIDGTLNAVVELYPDRIEALDERTLGNGPFRGVPFLIKDVFGHEQGRLIEYGSALWAGENEGGGGHLLRRHGQGGRREHPRPLRGAGIFHVGDHRERDVRQHLDAVEARLFCWRFERRRPSRGGGRYRADRPWLRHRRF